MSDHDAIVAVDPCRRIIDAAESLLNRLNPNVPWSAEALELQHALVAWERVEAAEDRAGELQAQVERLERERDEALAKIDALTRADYVFRAEAAEARAVQAERERDEYRQAAVAEAQLADEFQNALRHEKEAYGGGDVSMAQMLLRHESLSTTQAYLHPTKTDLAATLRVLDEAWQGSK